jgi:hypothetical protein
VFPKLSKASYSRLSPREGQGGVTCALGTCHTAGSQRNPQPPRDALPLTKHSLDGTVHLGVLVVLS